MNPPYSKMQIPCSDVTQATENARNICAELQEPNEMNELIHEIRQPLEVIESLAFYLELVSEEQQVFEHMRTIRSMVGRANRILEQHAVA